MAKQLSMKAINTRVDEAASFAKRVGSALHYLLKRDAEIQRRLDEIETAMGIEAITRQED